MLVWGKRSIHRVLWGVVSSHGAIYSAVRESISEVAVFAVHGPTWHFVTHRKEPPRIASVLCFLVPQTLRKMFAI